MVDFSFVIFSVTHLSPPPHPAKPADWVVRFADCIPRPLSGDDIILDLACGRGRHAMWLSKRGYRVLGVDRDLDSIRSNPAQQSHLNPQWIKADLESDDPFSAGGCLYGRRFCGIIVVNYLHRPLWPGIIGALNPGGVLIYETFAQGHAAFGHPRNPAYLLKQGELLDIAWSAEMIIIAYHHGRISQSKPAIKQCLCARKRAAPAA